MNPHWLQGFARRPRTQLAEVSASSLRLLTVGDKEHSRLERRLRGTGTAAAWEGDPAQRAGHRRTAACAAIRHPIRGSPGPGRGGQHRRAAGLAA